MAKIKTKKAKLSMKQGIDEILKSHGIDLDDSIKEPLLDDMIIYFNSVYKPDDKVLYWSELVSQYMSFYLELVGEKPLFNPIQAIALKKLSKVLMERYLKANNNGIWDLQVCLKQHDTFYRMVCTLDFYRRSFTVSLCYNNFDTIIAQLSDKRKKQQEIDEKILS